MRRFYCPDIDRHPASVTLDAEESHHLRSVLRLTVGDEVRAFDGEGREYISRVAEIGKHAVKLDILTETAPTAPESPCEITLATALLKHDKLETVIQKAVELGVVRLVPLITARCDVKPKDRTKRLQRWRRIALDAAKQSGRARLMNVGEPVELDEFLGIDHGGATKLFFSERGGQHVDLAPDTAKAVIVTGPEGGWDDAEIAAAVDNAFTPVTLGGRILRAETAAIAIAAIIQHRSGDIN